MNVMTQRIDGINEVLEAQGAGFRAEAASVYKPNLGERGGYALRPIENCEGMLAPILYWEPEMTFWSDEEIAKRMTDIVRDTRNTIVVPEITQAFVRENVMPKVLSAEHMAELMEHDIPFARISDTDLISLFYLPIESAEVTTTVTTQILRHVDMSLDEVFACAGRNALEQMTVRSLFSTLTGLMDTADVEDIGGDGLYVVTTRDMHYGSGVIAAGRAVLQRMGEALHTDEFFILPSSVHELLIVRDDGAFTFDGLLSMVTEINATQVAPADRLTDNVYHYDCKTGRLVHCK